MPPSYRRRVHCAYAEPAKPARKPAKKRSEMSELEKMEVDAKRIARKQIKDAKDEWEKTLPKPWNGPSHFSWPAGTAGIYKSDAKKSFGLTDKDIETLPHEAIQCSPKTFYALAGVSKLAAAKFAANALPAEFVAPGAPKGGMVRFFKKGDANPNRRVRTNWRDHGESLWLVVKDHYLGDGAA
ncbi:hypothetical protein VTO73DRAFT_13984 [Trametes versicolor]